MQQQYLRAGLLDEMHFAYVPLLLGRGERLWEASTTLRPGMKLRSSWELRRHFTSAL